jgi:hypothetical protein
MRKGLEREKERRKGLERGGKDYREEERTRERGGKD